jgi:hypothetical protein
MQVVPVKVRDINKVNDSEADLLCSETKCLRRSRIPEPAIANNEVSFPPVISTQGVMGAIRRFNTKWKLYLINSIPDQ